jgi:excisionase family DNA binding protein
MEKPKEVLNVDELAGYLDIPKSTVYKLVREGEIPARKVGRHWRFLKDAVDGWLANRGEDKPS